ncbi:hypothetical protein OC846_004594 [Tilletia horrida]|uniref:Uncharacterized protein n=1 Tax=Tilletia horrida TaxID=155126 RepID=A0AAN6JWS8_9BASI|nr:hypothetical protein OC846_004594 [Tilletia horrida]KAK0564178.1 hypothetical protein OC861_004435 [Tilletia horrida]
MSNIASIAVVIIGPLVIRKGIEFFRGGLRSSVCGLRSIPSPFSKHTPPCERVLLSITLGLVAYHIWALAYIQFFPHTNRITDVFLASDTPINAASVLLRERVTKHATGLFERLTDTYVPAGAAADELFRRLTSFEGRKIYLQVGEEPLLYCLFCVRPDDYKLYTLPTRLASYAVHFLLLGILTIGDPTLQLLNSALTRSRPDQSASSEKTESPSPVSNSSDKQGYQPSRAAWRRYALFVLVGGLVSEIFTLHNIADVRVGSGRWNHWHVNILLARHATFLALSILVYLLPTEPERVSVRTSSGQAPSTIQGALYALNSTTTTLQVTLAHLQALTLSNDVVATDAGLRALREAKAAQRSVLPPSPPVGTSMAAAGTASGAADAGEANSALSNGTASPSASGSTPITTTGAAAAEAIDPDQARQRQRQANLVRLAKRAGIDVDAVRKEAREAAETVLKETEKRAMEQEQRRAEAAAAAAAAGNGA